MRKILTLVLLVFMSTMAWAKGEVAWSVSQIEGSTSGKAVVVVQAAIQPGWHLYSIVHVDEGPFATKFEQDAKEIKEGIVEEPLYREFDKGFNKEINLFKDKATFWVPVDLGPNGLASKLTVKYQVCKDGVCIPPQPVELDLKSAKVVTESSKPAKQAEPIKDGKPGGATDIVSDPPQIEPGPTGTPTKPGEIGDIYNARSKGFLAYLWLAISAGFLALLTPCVFPMIPITVSFFSKKKEGESGLMSALLYCGGIIGTFTVLGIGVSIIAGATGLSKLANNPWMNLTLAAIFIVLALSLFGVFEIGLPSKFVNKFDSTGKSKFLAPILMGLTFSLTSFTCTLPFVGAVLVSAANGGGWFYPMVGMLGFSTAFCIPFMLLALFPSALSKLPKSGAWMVTVKAFMGFIELIAAVKFLSTFDLSFQFGLITREVNLALWFMLLVMAAIYLFGWIRLPKVHDGKIGPLRVAFGALTILVALKIGAAMNGGALGSLEGYLPPSPYPGKTNAPLAAWEKDFLPDFDAALAKAKENGKPIFIDFTGIYCTNCRVMERTVFPSEKVQNAFAKFNKVSLYTDRTFDDKYRESDTKNAALQQKLVGTATLPTYVVVKPDGQTLVGSTPFNDNIDTFTKFLEDSAK